jgi:hypothetical protein
MFTPIEIGTHILLTSPYPFLDTVAFNSVLQAWCTSGKINAAKRAEQLLKHMIKLYHAGNQDVRPDCISYSTVISTLASSNDQLAAEKSMDILYEMESKCALGDKDICPSVVTYTAGKTARRLCSSLIAIEPFDASIVYKL